MFKDFKKYAQKGHPSAMETLGNFYIVGYGTEKSESKALKMYKKQLSGTKEVRNMKLV
ncbi:MAG: hypothetical protein ABJH28_08330 [Paraglaciecola sp.]